MYLPTQRRVVSLLLVLIVILSVAPLAAAAPDASLAAISLTTVAYTQNFDSLGTAQTATLPTDWKMDKNTTVRTVGTYAGAVTTTEQRAGNSMSSTATNGIYNYGAGAADTATDRAAGWISSGSATQSGNLYVKFTNTTGQSLTGLTISYDAEKYRQGSNAAGFRIQMFYSTNGSTWTSAGSDFLTSFAADANNNGYASAPSVTVSISDKTLTFASPIAAGSDFYLAWNYSVTTGTTTSNAQGLGIDSVSVTAITSSVDNPPTVSSTNPANGASGVPPASNITVTFSEAVTIANINSFFDIFCDVSGTPTPQPAAGSGGPTVYTIDPTSLLPAGSVCTVTIKAAEVVDQDGNPDPMAANYVFSFTTAAADPCSLPFTPIYTIQGSGLTAAVTGAVTTQGVVVGDFELPGGSNQIRGFYLQDATGDANPATSDGIFVYNGGVDTVSVGQVVRVQGTAGEFSGQTQISGPTVTQCGVNGNVSPVDATLPFASADYPERLEGMLVRLPQTLYVTEHFQLGRFGQVVLTSRPDRLQQPTNVVAPGAPALALQAANNLDRIILDDNNNLQNTDPIVFGRGGLPLSASNTLRGGDSAANITGVLVYDWAGDSASPSAYRVRPVGALSRGVVNFQPANPRPATPTVAGRLLVASANLLNYFNTFGTTACTLGVGGGATDCRGADDSAEFARQWPKTVANLVDGGADVIGVMEMENDGYGPSSAIQDLVTKLNNATAPGTYAFINADALTGQTNALGVDAIKVGLIYKPAKVTPVGTTAALNSTAFVNGGDSAARNRPALAQAFQEISSGQRFIVVVNHLKSKGSACDAPDAGDGQGNCNVVRTSAANTLTAWLAGNPTGTGDPDILIIGDLNSYAQEDPITAIKNAGYSNLIQDRLGMSAYSYAFDGQWGYLDHALATPALASQVAGVVEWHINADEPSVLDYNTEFKTPGQIASLYSADRFRSSDHDPVMVGLNLQGALAVTLASFTAQGGADRITVAWETASEAGNAGFNLYRADSAAGPQTLLAYVPSQAPGAAQGASYSYEDLAVQPGQTYWYTLEDITLSGAASLHGPVSATVNAPTAVTLASVSASPATGVALPWLWVTAVVGVGAAVALIRRR